MANLIKTEHGLLFYDDFKEHTLMWTLSPSLANCISFTGKGLRMHHNKRYCTYTIPEPEVDEYSCIVNIDHIPYNTADIAGVIVISSNKEYAECQTYMAFGPSEINNSIQYEDDLNLHIHNFLRDNNYVQWTENDEEIPIIPGSVEAGGSGGSSSIPPPGITPPTGPFVDTTYHYIKMTKTKYKYIFYASPDGFDWIEVGNVKFASAGVIGFFIYASDNEDLISPRVEDVILSDGTIGSNVIDNSHCYIKDFAIYTSKYLTFYNISRDYEFEILDKDCKVIARTDLFNNQYLVYRTNKETILNTTMLPTPIVNSRIRIYDKDDYDKTIMEFDLGEKVYGGDKFSLERDIKIFINNIEIDQTKVYDLGTFYRNSDFIKVDIYNNEDFTINNLNIKVIKYSEYYEGEEEIYISLYDESQNIDTLEYKKQLKIDSISPSEGKAFFMRLVEKPVQNFYNTANSFRFKILVE